MNSLFLTNKVSEVRRKICYWKTMQYDFFKML